MTVWMDLTNSLTQHKGNVADIVRAELMLAKNLHDIDSSIRFSVLTDYGFKEVKKSKLRWLFKSQNLNDDYLKYQKRKELFSVFEKVNKKILYEIFRFKRHYIKPRNISRNKYLTYPYKNNDTVFSCGCFGTNKEQFFSRIKAQLQNFKLVYAIYDLMLIKEDLRCICHPQDILFENYLNWISNNCDMVVYGGKTAQIDAEKYFMENNFNIPKGFLVKWGDDIKKQKSKQDSEKILEKLEIKKPYILAVGSFDYKKNYRVLYQAFCQLKQRDAKNIPQLVIVGKKIKGAELQDTMLENPLTKDYIKIIECSDEELDILYKNCEFTVLPTLYEGWSLKLPESLSYGKLCLCSDVASLREVGGDCGYYIDSNSAKGWADAIESFMNNPKKISEYEEKIHKNWKCVSWKESAQNLYNYLTELKNVNSEKNVIVNTNKPTLYYDIILLWHQGLSGIPRTQMLLARYLYKHNKDIKYFWINNGVYCELSHRQLSHLLSKESLDKAVKQVRQTVSGYVTKENLPFKKNDVVFSAGVGFDDISLKKLAEHHKNVGFKYCSVIYDFTPITVPHTHPKDRLEWYPTFLKYIYDTSDYVFYGGKTAQADGEKYQRDNNLPVKKSFALKWGADIVSKKHTKAEVEAVMEKYGIIGDYIITVGTIEARKNQQVLYEAYLELMRSAKRGEKLPQIIICGNPGWKTEEFRHLVDIDERVKGKVMLITPTDDELDILYQNCKFTCLPSFYEGWSLTLPESLNYGKFCLASDTPSLKETGEDIIDYANPYDPIEWAQKIKFYCTNTKALKKRESLIKKKWHNTTWAECAENLNKILHKFMEK